MKKVIRSLPYVLVLIIIFGTIYVVTQQSERTAANYPQIQLAEDTAASLDASKTPRSLTHGAIDINMSLAPFVIIYSKFGQIVAGNGYLNGHLPSAPIGILLSARGKEYHWISWQPQADVRIAAVTVAARNYYVLSGRSLKQIEANENDSFWYSFSGGVLSLIVLGMTYEIRKRY